MNKIVITLMVFGLVALLATGTLAQSYANTEDSVKEKEVQSVSALKTGMLKKINDTQLRPVQTSPEEWETIESESEGSGGDQGGYSANYFKTCAYTWDSTSYLNQEVKIIASIEDSSGERESDEVNVKVVDYASSGSGSYHSMPGENLEIQITSPGEGNEVSRDVEVKATAKGPYELDQMVLSFESEGLGHSIGLPDEYCEEGGSVPPPTGRVKVSIYPSTQYSDDGTASYKVVVTDVHRPTVNICETDNADCAVAVTNNRYKYEFEFEAKDCVLGTFDTDTLLLRPGESETVLLTVKTKEDGSHIFNVKAEGSDTEGIARGMLIVGGNDEPPYSDLRIKLDSEKQYSDDGSATYKVILARNKITLTSADAREKTYILKFDSSQKEIRGEFEREKVSLAPGETEAVELFVKADRKGSYVFSVKAVDENSNPTPAAKGLLVVRSYEPPTPTPSFFEGSGFAINKDSSEGELVSLHILKGGEEVRGKMKFGNDDYALKGTYSNEDLSFSLYETRDGAFTASIGEFHGQVKQFDEFLLLTGGLEFETKSGANQYWSLTAIGKRKAIFRDEISIDSSNDEARVEETKLEEITTIVSENDNAREEFYITPKKFTKSFFGIKNRYIGTDVLEVEVIDEEGKVYKETLRPGRKEKIGEWEIEVEKESFKESDESVEFSVTKLE
ncbi:MAG: hypothetical protein KKD94_00305 [Nanoarchaeota archaeon]|nr:hypothetical protein [Nanoarchaeota archaeon]MBU1987910.1 hypothetical protein [Nanoarchaeota archaeon]